MEKLLHNDVHMVINLVHAYIGDSSVMEIGLCFLASVADISCAY